MLDLLQVPYHHTPTFHGASTTSAISSQLTLVILVGFVEENMSPILEAVH